jgi:uncharacterized iron-regulated membrane protein
MRGVVDMKWFRSNIKHGSKLALLALAIQFVLSFGHFHGVAAQAAAAVQSATQSVAASPNAPHTLAAPDAATQSIQGQQQKPKPASDHDSHDACAICAVIAMANAVLFSTPPLLELPQAVELLYLTTDAEFIRLNSIHVAFQPRAPPIS